MDLKKSDIQPTASATFITGSSFTEKAYNDMKAMLSDTVDINKGYTWFTLIFFIAMNPYQQVEIPQEHFPV